MAVPSSFIVCRGKSMMDSNINVSFHRTIFLCKNGMVGLSVDSCGDDITV